MKISEGMQDMITHALRVAADKYQANADLLRNIEKDYTDPKPDYLKLAKEFDIQANEARRLASFIDVEGPIEFKERFPLETAPKDGTRIILFRKWAESMCIGYWSTDFNHWSMVGNVGVPFIDASEWTHCPYDLFNRGNKK